MARLEPAGVDQVMISNMAPHDLDIEVGLMEELRAAGAAA
jgi:hypothetical protein